MSLLEAGLRKHVETSLRDDGAVYLRGVCNGVNRRCSFGALWLVCSFIEGQCLGLEAVAPSSLPYSVFSMQAAPENQAEQRALVIT